MKLAKLVTVETRNLRHANGSHIRRRSVVHTFDGQSVGFLEKGASKRLIPQVLRALARNTNAVAEDDEYAS